MKRFLLLPILMFGLSFACDQPYEEVAGIKIGCPLGDSDGYKGYFWGEGIYGGDSHVKSLDDGGIFTIQIVLSIDGVAEGVILSSRNGVDKEVFNVLTKSLEERWGKPSLSDDSWDSTIVVFGSPNSEIVTNIITGYDKKDGVVKLLYQSKKSVDAGQKEEGAKKADIKKGFDGL